MLYVQAGVSLLLIQQPSACDIGVAPGAAVLEVALKLLHTHTVSGMRIKPSCGGDDGPKGTEAQMDPSQDDWLIAVLG